jgi:cleavage and polyadenylation specificity factor subunit 6/7
LLFQVQGEFAGDGVDLYDDVIAAAPGNNERGTSESSDRGDRDREASNEETNGNAPYHQLGNNIQPNQIGRRHQLYVGNLTWVSYL